MKIPQIFTTNNQSGLSLNQVSKCCAYISTDKWYPKLTPSYTTFDAWPCGSPDCYMVPTYLRLYMCNIFTLDQAVAQTGLCYVMTSLVPSHGVSYKSNDCHVLTVTRHFMFHHDLGNCGSFYPDMPSCINTGNFYPSLPSISSPNHVI